MSAPRLCPNTSPLLVLSRMDRLDLLGDGASALVTETVADEVLEKPDDAARRFATWHRGGRFVVEIPRHVDPLRTLGPGERSVLALSLLHPDATAVLDDAAARSEARRLALPFTGTLGLVLRARREGRIPLVEPVLRDALAAGLYLDARTVRAALASVGEPSAASE